MWHPRLLIGLGLGLFQSPDGGEFRCGLALP